MHAQGKDRAQNRHHRLRANCFPLRVVVCHHLRGAVSMSDLTYRNDGMFVTFTPQTALGERVWSEMNAKDNHTVFACHLPAVLKQIRAAGYSVTKSKPVKAAGDDALLAALFD